jgi:probable HAF family extracellular repeat protein
MNGPNSFATDIAEDGTVVGYVGGNHVSAFTRGFIWQAGTVTDLPTVPEGLNSLVSCCEEKRNM